MSRTSCTSMRRLLGWLLIMTMVVAACSSGDGGDSAGPGEDTESPTDSTVSIVPGGVQQLWVFDRVVAVDLDGTERDVAPDMVEQADASAQERVEITTTGSFVPAADLNPQMIDDSGGVVDAVDLTAGVFEAGDGTRSVALLATPVDGEWLIGRDYTLRLDLPTSAEVTAGTPLVVDLFYVQYLPIEGADGLGDDVDPIELWQDRADAGSIAYLANEDGNSQVVSAEVGVAHNIEAEGGASGVHGLVAPAQADDSDDDGGGLAESAAEEAANRAKDALIDEISNEVADKLDIPADARPLLEGIRDGVREAMPDKCRSVSCIKDLTDKIEEGFEESWKEIEDQLDLDPDRDPDPEDPEPDDPDPDDPDPGDPPPDDPPPDDPPRTTRPPHPPNPPISNPPSTPPATPTTTIPPSTTSSTTTTPPSTTATSCPDCDGPPSGGGGGGGGGGASILDPHIYTFDGRNYGLMVVGEFTLAKSDDFELQARYAPVPCACRASLGSAAVVSTGDHRIEVSRTDIGAVLVDGERIELDEQPEIRVDDVVITRKTGGIAVSDGQGNLTELTYSPKWVNMRLTPGSDTDGWVGILGNSNGDDTDEFTTRDGEDLGPNPGTEVIEGAFADSWRITDEMSLFSYGPGESTATFTDAQYPAPHLEISDEELAADREARRPQAETVCGLVLTDPDLRDDCVSDFTVTGNFMIVNDARRAEFGLGRYRKVSDGQSDDGATPSTSGAELVATASYAIDKGRPLPAGDGIALMPVEIDDRGSLVAMDIETRSIRWTVPDIDVGCRPTIVEGVGVVARLQKGSETLGADEDALVLLSSSDGTELARYAPGDTDLDCAELVADAGPDSEGMVVSSRGSSVNAYRVGADIEPLWSRRIARREPIAVIDGHLIAVVAEDVAGTTYGSLDLDSGEMVSEMTIESVDQLTVTPVGDGLFTVSMGGGGQRSLPATAALVKVDGGRLDVLWAQAEAEDEPDIPVRLARTGDVVVGWTSHGDGEGLIAFAIEDGETAWTYTATSFDNTRDMVVGTPEVALVAPFGGAWVEIVGADGEAVRIVDEAPQDDQGGPAQLTVIDDDTVLATGNIDDGGVYFEFIDL